MASQAWEDYQKALEEVKKLEELYYENQTPKAPRGVMIAAYNHALRTLEKAKGSLFDPRYAEDKKCPRCLQEKENDS